jgi:hypothetical protein
MGIYPGVQHLVHPPVSSLLLAVLRVDRRLHHIFAMVEVAGIELSLRTGAYSAIVLEAFDGKAPSQAT